MRLFTAEEMRSADQAAITAGIPALLLMEAAGRSSARHARARFPRAQSILVLCGPGNNGGDGYGAARYLQALGPRVEVLELSPEPRSPEGRAMRSAWLARGNRTAPLTPERLSQAIGSADLVVDALFGSGLTRPLEGENAALTTALAGAAPPVFSIDVPSGIDADRAEPIGPNVMATFTLQLAGPKPASVFSPAAASFGRWDVADIGIPEGILEGCSSRLLLDAATVRPWLPTRPRDTHKYRVGTVLVVAGSARYAGAAELACRAALRSGAGLVTLASESRAASGWPEIVFEELDWSERPLHALAGIGEKRAQARVIGPGLDERARRHVPGLIAASGVPTVLDAGAFESSEPWFDAVREHGSCVLTPHAGEASRLLDIPAGQIGSDPLAAAQELASRSGAVVVLKGASTVVAAPDARVAVNGRSHPGMATAGSGDVLAGCLGAWLAGEQDPFERAAAAVFVHGAAGVLAAERYGDGLVASDLIEAFPRVWHRLARGDKLPGR